MCLHEKQIGRKIPKRPLNNKIDRYRPRPHRFDNNSFRKIKFCDKKSFRLQKVATWSYVKGQRVSGCHLVGVGGLRVLFRPQVRAGGLATALEDNCFQVSDIEEK